jgi:UDPglucose 6-dehydrogenase
MRIGIVGTGHVGLVTAVGLAHLGHTVVGMDKNAECIASLARGVPTLYEPELPELLRSTLQAGRVRFTTSVAEMLHGSDIVFLCVGTPSHPDGKADLSQIEEAVNGMAPHLNGFTLIVEKSTVPVGTAASIDRAIRQATEGTTRFEVASNPEFLREGSAVHDFLHPDRIVVGADSERARAMLRELYGDDFACPVLVTSVRVAELIKHAANAFLATKLSFINMIADFCDQVGADVSDVARGIGLDPRIGAGFLGAGIGYGGSCFGKDLQAFVRSAADRGVDFALLREVERINEARVDRLLRKLGQALWVMRGKTVGVLGVAFKAETDDIRDAPSLKVIPRLRENDVTLRIYDPRAASKLAALWQGDDRLTYVESAEEAARGAHALLILTDWPEFRSLDMDRMRSMMRTPVLVDGRNLFDPAQMRARGFDYYSLGRGDVAREPAATAV